MSNKKDILTASALALGIAGAPSAHGGENGPHNLQNSNINNAPQTHLVTASTSEKVASLRSVFSTPNASLGAVNHGRETGIAGAITFPNGDMGIRIGADVSAHELHALLAAGYAFKNGYIIIGGSHATEQAQELGSNKNLRGESAYLKINLAPNINPRLRNAFVEIIGKNAHAATLDSTTTTSLSVQTQQLADAIKEITTQNTTTTTRRFSGGHELTSRLGVELNIGRNGILELNVFNTQGISENRTDAGMKYTQYFPQAKTRFEIAADTNRQVRTDVFKALGNSNWDLGIGAFTDRTHNTGGLVTLRYNFGRTHTSTNTDSNYRRPDAPQAQMFADLNRLDTTSEAAISSLSRYGTVKTTQNTTTTTVSEKTDHLTKTVAPTFTIDGDTLTVTSHGISDNDGTVTDVVYILQGSNTTHQNNTGKFTGLAAGSYILSTQGKVIDGITHERKEVSNLQTAPVTIAAHIEQIPTTLTAFTGLPNGEVFIGDTFTLAAETNSQGQKTYTSSDATIAKIDNNGKVTILSAGTFTVTVHIAETTANGKHYNAETFTTKTITAQKKITSTEVQIGNITCDTTILIEGNTATCSITPEDAEGIAHVSATIDGKTVAVNQNGATYSVKATGLSVGEHALIWQVQGKKSDGSLEAIKTSNPQKITVEQNIQQVQTTLTLENLPSTELLVGDTFTVQAQSNSPAKITYKTSNPNIASIDNNGKVTILSAGQFTITAEVPTIQQDGKNYSARDITSSTITAKIPNTAPVMPSIPSISATSGTAGSIVLPAATDANNDPLTYSVTSLPQGFSFDAKTRTISWDANTVAGSYTLQAKANDGKADSNTVNISVTVNAKPTDKAETVNLSTITVQDGKLLPFDQTAVIQDEDGVQNIRVTLNGTAIDPTQSHDLAEGNNTVNITAEVKNGATGQWITVQKSKSFDYQKPIAAPTVPANIPTEIDTNYANTYTLDLSPYMQSGWELEVIDVADPAYQYNGGIHLQVSTTSHSVTVSLPDGYGYEHIPITARFKNTAGQSEIFTVVLKYMADVH